jgi:hypothetical protein
LHRQSKLEFQRQYNRLVARRIALKADVEACLSLMRRGRAAARPNACRTRIMVLRGDVDAFVSLLRGGAAQAQVQLGGLSYR